ncbi:MAG: phosphoribosylglycinamide formyltransferase [Anaerolineae bacterium]
MVESGSKARIAVLVSGHGTNLQAIIDRTRDGYVPNAEVVVVVSNRKDAYGLERARQAGIATEYLPLKRYRDAGKARTEYDADLAEMLRRYRPDWIVLAGWMHIMSDAFLRHFRGKVINLHPALPGQLPGMHSIERAYEAFNRGEAAHTGVMVHMVPDEGVDVGPAVLIREVPILPSDTLEDLEARVHAVEHGILPEALRRLIGKESGARSQEIGNRLQGMGVGN